MCTKPSGKLAPEYILSMFLSNKLNTSISSDDVVRLIRDDWETLAMYSHEIHDRLEKEDLVGAGQLGT